MDTHIVGEYDLDEIGRSGYGHIPVKVTGYWSRDSISVYVRRNERRKPTWEITMSHSSGGRDTNELADGIQAEANFGAALLDMANVFVPYLRTQLPRLEKLWQEEKARRKEEE